MVWLASGNNSSFFMENKKISINSNFINCSSYLNKRHIQNHIYLFYFWNFLSGIAVACFRNNISMSSQYQFHVFWRNYFFQLFKFYNFIKNILLGCEYLLLLNCCNQGKNNCVQPWFLDSWKTCCKEDIKWVERLIFTVTKTSHK